VATKDHGGSYLDGIRVVELANELGEYAGLVFAGLGADVIKVEPPGGESTRRIGPFKDDVPGPNQSLHFWHYNFGKRSVIIDLDTPDGVAEFEELVASADVLIDTRHRCYLPDRGLSYESLRRKNEGLIYVRISPFGDDGPWEAYEGSDLVHLALGGVVMNCGYDPQPSGFYDTPPVAPQMWQSYHITGEVTAIQVIAALLYRADTGVGQMLSASVHDAVSKNTEADVPNWIYSRLPHQRLTCRHSVGTREAPKPGKVGAAKPSIARTKDGRWILPYRTYLRGLGTPLDSIVRILKRFGMEDDLEDPRYSDSSGVSNLDTVTHVTAVVEKFVGSFKFDRDLWKEGQRERIAWAPLRRPEENLDDDHWAQREVFGLVEYPELGKSYRQIRAKWFSPQVRWRTGPRAPQLGEHTLEVLTESGQRSRSPRPDDAPRTSEPVVVSERGRPFALSGVRIVDLTWMLATGGAGRFFTAHGAEVIKVEHKSRHDGMRYGPGTAPAGGREERLKATGPVPLGGPDNLNRSGGFMEINSGKLSLGLNLKSEEGRKVLVQLIRDSDMVIEGFSPGTMDRLGLGYEELRKVNPNIIYVQQSGMGQHGKYADMRSYGPTAQALSGLSEMSGLPEPYSPAGIGYSYLDWFGAYQMALAMMAALHRKRVTGAGCWIDSSQVETGIYLSGTAILDYTVNGRRWARYGNRSPYKPAAPHGVYPTAGTDRWIAIAVFDDQRWHRLTQVLGLQRYESDPRLVTLNERMRNQDFLDGLIADATAVWEPFELMDALQRVGVPAGVCQTAEDRCDHDPQLSHGGWLVELDQAELGRWPVKEVPVTFSETPPYVGGRYNRSGPSYAQDTEFVLREILKMSDDDIQTLIELGAVDSGGVRQVMTAAERPQS
jgi:crotonobetainyl-CoA:carnitine CoA-transferase CaiB-like acyl-CoA transferase